MKVLHCSKFMNVYLFTTKIHKGATIGMHVHIAFHLKIYDKTPNDFDEKKALRPSDPNGWPSVPSDWSSDLSGWPSSWPSDPSN